VVQGFCLVVEGFIMEVFHGGNFFHHRYGVGINVGYAVVHNGHMVAEPADDGHFPSKQFAGNRRVGQLKWVEVVAHVNNINIGKPKFNYFTWGKMIWVKYMEF